jgi:hypothetical protein
MSFNTKVHFEQGGAQLTVESGGAVDVKAGGELKIAGTAVTASAAELNTLAGATANMTKLANISASAADINTAAALQYILNAYMADAGTASDTFVVVPFAGVIKKLSAVNHAACTTTKTVLTAFIGAVAITHPAWEIALAAAAGTASEVIPTAGVDVEAGEVIKIHSDGATDATMPTTFTIMIER